MENLDIIILSSIVTTLFVVFLGVTIKEFSQASKKPQPRQSDENGPRAKFIKFIGKQFDTDVKVIK